MFLEMIHSGNGLLTSGYCIALLGGGGKTSLQKQLGNEVAQAGNKTLLTSLTKSGEIDGYNLIFLDNEDPANFELNFDESNPVYVMGSRINDSKLRGISEKKLKEIKKSSDAVVVECDGARNRPIKTHKSHDPMVPEFATHAIIVVGADAVGASLKNNRIHREGLFKEKWQISDNYILDAEFAAKVVTSRRGYLEKIPEHIKPVYFVNKSDSFPTEAKILAEAIKAQSGNDTWYGSTNGQLLQRVE